MTSPWKMTHSYRTHHHCRYLPLDQREAPAVEVAEVEWVEDPEEEVEEQEEVQEEEDHHLRFSHLRHQQGYNSHLRHQQGGNNSQEGR